MSMFHGILSINNVFVDQNTLGVKLADYGYYNDIYTENVLDLFEGSKMDLFCLAIIIIKCIGKLRIDLPLDLGSLQFKVPLLKQLYKGTTISKKLGSFIDILFDNNVTLAKVMIHPFVNMTTPENQKSTTDDTFYKSSPSQSPNIKPKEFLNQKLGDIKEMTDEKSEFTFCSNKRNSYSSGTSDSK